MFTEYIHNATLLLSLLSIYRVIVFRIRKETTAFQMIAGLLFGLVAVLGMMTPVTYQPGIIYDGRSIVIGVAGLASGPLATLIAVALALAYRLWLGGGGAIVGAGVILASAALGLLFHELRRRSLLQATPATLYAFGFLLHVVMLVLQLALPEGKGFTIVPQIALPVMLIFPAVTLLISILILDAENQNHDRRALQESEARYRAFFENAAVMVAILDASGHIVAINEAGERFLGYGKGELIRQHFSRFTHPQDVTFDEEMLRALTKGRVHQNEVEKRFLRKDGTVVWGHVAVASIRRGEDQPPYVTVVCYDITARKHAEDEIIKSHNQLRQAHRIAHLGSFEYDPAAGNIAWSNEANAVLGTRGMTLKGPLENNQSRVHPEDVPAALQAVERIQSPEGNGNAELRIIRPDGEIRSVVLYFEPIIEEGVPIRTIGTIQDVTELRRIEQSLRESESQFRSMVEGAPDAISIQVNGRYEYMNQKALQMFGATHPSEILGKAVLDHIHPASHELVLRRMTALAQAHQPLPLAEVMIRRLDGTPLWVETSGQPIQYRGEWGGLIFMREISERKAGEKQIIAQLEELRRWHGAMLDREKRNIQLKGEVNELLRAAGLPARYLIDSDLPPR